MPKETVQASKKFRAFAISTAGWNILILVAMYLYLPLTQWQMLVLLAMIVVQGVVQVGYIIGQAGLDALIALFDTITPDSLFGGRKKLGKGPQHKQLESELLTEQRPEVGTTPENLV